MIATRNRALDAVRASATATAVLATPFRRGDGDHGGAGLARRAPEFLKKRRGRLREGGSGPIDHRIRRARIEKVVQPRQDRRTVMRRHGNAAGRDHGRRARWHGCGKPFCQQRGQETQKQSRGDRRANDQHAFGRTRCSGHRRARDHPRVGILDDVLVLRFAQARDEGFVHRPRGLRVGFQRLELNACEILGACLLLRLREARLQRSDLRAGHKDVVGDGSGEAIDLGGDLVLEISFLCLDRRHLGMQRTVFRGEFGFLRDQRSLLRAQLHDQRRCEDLGNIRSVAGLRQGRDAIASRLLLREIGLGKDQLVADGTDLLVREGRAVARLVQIVIGLVSLHRGFIGLHLIRKLTGAVDEPSCRPAADRALGLDLILDIGIDQRIGDERSLTGIT